MSVFISWSEEPSRSVAEVLRVHLKQIIQGLDVYVSDHSIGAGERWQLHINRALEERNFGILCVTAANQAQPWLLFEAGALAKQLDARVCALLLGDTSHTDIRPPLSQFQNQRFDEDGVRKLVVSINDTLAAPLEPEVLDAAFAKWWPDIETGYAKAIDGVNATPTERTEGDMLKELLTLVRQLDVPNTSTGLQLPLRFERIATDTDARLRAIESTLRRGHRDPEGVVLPRAAIEHIAEALVMYVDPATALLPLEEDEELSPKLHSHFKGLLDMFLSATGARIERSGGMLRATMDQDPDD